MDFQVTAEQQALVESVTKLSRAEFGDVREGGKPLPHIPRGPLAALARNGFAGLTLPESDGGQGGTLLDQVLALEAAAAVNPTAGDALQALNFGAIQQVAHHGSDELRQRFLAPCLRGELLTAIAMSEPDAGSAVTALSTTARRDGDQMVLNGRKIFTTHGADADFFVAWVRFGEGRDEVGGVIVERGSPGFEVDASNTFMSGEHYGMLYFDDARVPASNVLIDHDGFRRLFPIFNIERLGNATRSLALGQTAFDLALAYARQREQFGQPLADFQGLRWRFAEMATQLDSARLLLYRAAVNAEGQKPRPLETSMAKLACNRAGYEVADQAMQIFGGYGYDQAAVVNYLVRRTRGWMIAGGTIEQMLDGIAKGLLRQAARQDA